MDITSQLKIEERRKMDKAMWNQEVKQFIINELNLPKF